MPVLSHYSKQPICVHPDQPPPDNAHKPGGLWLSDDTAYGWRQFLGDRERNGDPDWTDAADLQRYRADFVILPSWLDDVLVMRTPDDLLAFVNKYGAPSARSCADGYGRHMEWDRVKADYKGMLITPYQPTLSRVDPEFHWYRFDCASGCFWDISALTRLDRCDINDTRMTPDRQRETGCVVCRNRAPSASPAPA